MQRLGTGNKIMMKKIFIVLIVLAAGCSEKKKAEVDLSLMAPAEFNKELHATEGAILVDVRTPQELQLEYLPHARNLDFKNPHFKDLLANYDKEKTYFVYCASGVRSGRAAVMMKDMGFKHVVMMEGGLQEWDQAGLPVTSARTLPPNVQLIPESMGFFVKVGDVTVAEIQCDSAVEDYCTAYRVALQGAHDESQPELFYSRQEALDWALAHIEKFTNKSDVSS